jgi:two-component system, sensor histidine kinase and response regulator
LGGLAPGPATGEDRLSQARHDVLLVAASLATDEGFARLLALRAAQVPADLPCVLLVRAGSDGGPVAATVADAVLVKPATGTALRRSLLQALDPRRRVAAAASDGLPLPGLAEQRLRARHAGQCVLLAEDNPVNHEIAEAQLRWVGLDVRFACQGDEAVTMALTGAFDLVLMDMHMPVMDGIAATRAIRAAGVDRLPIIAMTASAYAEDRAACLAAGMNDHLAKPAEFEALYALLVRWLPNPDAEPPPAGTMR